MGIINVVRTIKELHKEDIVMIRVGKFLNVYGKDAVIISYMFNYQIKKVEGNVNCCGFPEVALNKVISRLEDKSINYKVIDRSNEYNVELEESYKKKNKYNEIYSIANKYIKYRNCKRRLKKKIYQYREGYISLNSILSTINNYENLTNKKLVVRY